MVGQVDNGLVATLAACAQERFAHAEAVRPWHGRPRILIIKGSWSPADPASATDAALGALA